MKNKVERLREEAEAIYRAGLTAVDPAMAVRRHVRREGNILRVGERSYNLDDFENVLVVGAGKAAAAMAQPLEEILGERLTEGHVNVKYGHAKALERIQVCEAGHPVPDEAGRGGAEKIIELVCRAREKDLVFFLISGGGSALLPVPAGGLTLEEKQQVTKLLLECGAAIHEINAVRKHISAVKGGQLARLAHPATLISLILSDVVGDRPDSIASGPTVPDEMTFGDCLHILEKYELTITIPRAILEHFEKGKRGEIPETPKPGDEAFSRTQNLIIANNAQAVEAAAEKARSLGFNTLVLSTFVEGEAREIARMHTALAKEVLRSGQPVRRPGCLISGGETTVKVRGKGLGGRNQEFCLAAAIGIEGLEDVVILSGATDGTDGPTDAAGAIVDGSTVQRGRALGLEAEAYLGNNDSYHFFQPLGDLLVTGATLTNVMDLHIVIVR
ncbi:MAG: glycerate kinase [Clostridiales bacterium]|nr:glycerate kinase [Clostridiales bacterium]